MTIESRSQPISRTVPDGMNILTGAPSRSARARSTGSSLAARCAPAREIASDDVAHIATNSNALASARIVRALEELDLLTIRRREKPLQRDVVWIARQGILLLRDAPVDDGEIAVERRGGGGSHHRALHLEVVQQPARLILVESRRIGRACERDVSSGRRSAHRARAPALHLGERRDEQRRRERRGRDREPRAMASYDRVRLHRLTEPYDLRLLDARADRGPEIVE